MGFITCEMCDSLCVCRENEKRGGVEREGRYLWVRNRSVRSANGSSTLVKGHAFPR